MMRNMRISTIARVSRLFATCLSAALTLWADAQTASAANPTNGDKAACDPSAASWPGPRPSNTPGTSRSGFMFVCLDPCTWQGREYDNHSTPLSAINPDPTRHRPMVPRREAVGREGNPLRRQAHRRLLLVADRDDEIRHQGDRVERRQGRRAGGVVRLLPQARTEPGHLRLSRRRHLGRADGQRRAHQRSVEAGSLQQGLPPAVDRSAHALRQDHRGLVRRQLRD